MTDLLWGGIGEVLQDKVFNTALPLRHNPISISSALIWSSLRELSRLCSCPLSFIILISSLHTDTGYMQHTDEHTCPIFKKGKGNWMNATEQLSQTFSYSLSVELLSGYRKPLVGLI